MRQVRRVAKATIQNSSIGRAGIRVYDAGRILFQGGGGVVIEDSGYINIDGDLTGAGSFDWTGPWKLAGSGQVTAATTAWSGDIRLTGDIIVFPGGRFVIGNMVIDPTANGGSIKFSGGPEVYADGSKLSLYSGLGAFIELDGSVAKINGPGARWLEVSSSGFRFVGLPAKTGTGLTPGLPWLDPDGTLYRIAS